ncbi:PF02995 domain protein [Leptospira interrogans str. 2006001854]|uniref:PF02995 domain protein n=1 Tax=Leptospira interrogans str. 2006001854 TaxID=1001590 RepID=M6GFG8_LEPIR|nr:PF02995 domain protein [Leptospira interrogans str. 2006001854]
MKEIFNFLNQENLMENTLVIFTSDHGKPFLNTIILVI